MHPRSNRRTLEGAVDSVKQTTAAIKPGLIHSCPTLSGRLPQNSSRVLRNGENIFTNINELSVTEKVMLPCSVPQRFMSLHP